MQPEIDVLGVSIKTFGVFFALNFVAWGALVNRRLREIGKPPDWAYEIVAVALLGGLIGARGYWLIQNHEALSFGNVLGGSVTDLPSALLHCFARDRRLREYRCLSYRK